MTTNVTTSTTNGASPDSAATLELYLTITDPDLYTELSKRGEPERSEFAISAMKIGVIALGQAQGRIDADRVRQEGDRFIENMGHALTEHQHSVIEQIGNSLKTYFDPDSGRFNERVQKLVGQNGELEQVLRKQIEGTDSSLAQTLAAHVGQSSPLMQIIHPEAVGGLIAQIRQSTEEELTAQRERILSEFSKDNQDSAINRLIAELINNHGEVGKALEERISAMVSEFSLDKEDSALTRLMNGVERAQRQITSEFSLDTDGSALARMRKEFLDAIEAQRQTNEQFQRDVIAKLTEMTARKQESERGTRHGLEFESAVFGFINEWSQKTGNIAEHTGNTTGLIRNNKTGDVVIELGPDAVAAGAKVVTEAKEDASYTLKKAREELDEARKNRGADIGIFVFSKRTAPNGLDSFNRYGSDVVVIWDAEDPGSDVFLDAALSVAKALCLHPKSHSKEIGADFEAIEKAILEVERQAYGLNEITTSAQTIHSGSEKILHRARIMREGLDKQISILNEKVAGLREVVGNDS